MKKSIWIAVALAAMLFVYGFVMTYEGDEHSVHHQGSHTAGTNT